MTLMISLLVLQLLHGTKPSNIGVQMLPIGGSKTVASSYCVSLSSIKIIDYLVGSYDRI